MCEIKLGSRLISRAEQHDRRKMPEEVRRLDIATDVFEENLSTWESLLQNDPDKRMADTPIEFCIANEQKVEETSAASPRNDVVFVIEDCLRDLQASELTSHKGIQERAYQCTVRLLRKHRRKILHKI